MALYQVVSQDTYTCIGRFAGHCPFLVCFAGVFLTPVRVSVHIPCIYFRSRAYLWYANWPVLILVVTNVTLILDIWCCALSYTETLRVTANLHFASTPYGLWQRRARWTTTFTVSNRLKLGQCCWWSIPTVVKVHGGLPVS